MCTDIFIPVKYKLGKKTNGKKKTKQKSVQFVIVYSDISHRIVINNCQEHGETSSKQSGLHWRHT